MNYKGFILEPFQEEAISAINSGNDVIVSTHTGNGKTLVADYVIDKCMNEGKTIIYTAPIKALSNQKYREMVAMYGEDKVGLITGDIVINQDAQVLLVTTEILRNIIHEAPNREILKKLAFIILDEIHYINDKDRGTVWEEIILFRNPNTKILGLSATVPNAKDLSDWIEEVSGNPCTLIRYDERIIKQTHAFFDKRRGPISFDDMVYELNKALKKGNVPPKTSHGDFIKYSQKNDLFPILFFSFSRRSCEEKAEEASERFNLLTQEENEKVRGIIRDFEGQYPELSMSPSWQKAVSSALVGICSHHAGLLPLTKRFVERLFENKLCKILYATETFAVGINFPVRTVCFVALRKFDGNGFRNLNGSEYLQMAGRAGRRGYDETGKVFTLCNYDDLLKERVMDISTLKPEPVNSQFCLCYNTVLNLISNYKEEEYKKIFEKGLSNFQYKGTLKDLEPQCNFYQTNKCPVYIEMKAKHKKNKNRFADECDCANESENIKPIHCNKVKKKKCEKFMRIMRNGENKTPSKKLANDFGRKICLLQDLSYINENNELNIRGQICKNFHIQELLLTELIFEKNLLNYPIERFMGIIGGLCYDGKDDSPPIRKENEVYDTINFLLQKEFEHKMIAKNSFNAKGYLIVKAWLENKTFSEISCMYNCEEGDFVSIIRRTIDVLRQIKIAFSHDIEIVKYMNACIKKADRDIVQYFM